jgi:hypothetical protein
VNTRTWPAKQPYYRRPYRLELLWKPRSDTQVPGTWYSVLNTCYLILYTWYFCTWTMSIASSVPGSAICLLRFFPSALYVMNLPSPDCQFRALELCNNNCKNDVNLFDDAWISGSASLSLTTEPVSFTASSLHPMLTRHGVSSGVRPDRRQSPGLLRFYSRSSRGSFAEMAVRSTRRSAFSCLSCHRYRACPTSPRQIARPPRADRLHSSLHPPWHLDVS